MFEGGGGKSDGGGGGGKESEIVQVSELEISHARRLMTKLNCEKITTAVR